MHRGVREFVAWIGAHADRPDVALNPPASRADIAALEQMLGGPLPADLRFVLTRFNGGTLPAGQMLPAGIEPGTIGHTVREYAEAVGMDFLDPELLLPFHRTLEGSLLAFDRAAGPVSDTWPIVDYYEDLDEHRLMYRTFDGWCRVCVAEWTSEDFGQEFSLETYLRAGMRHASIETDVATAHATVAHALKRAGRPLDALHAYVRAARCVPPLHWCDWEALKLAVLLRRPTEALESLSRLSSRAPSDRWGQRETTPGKVAEVVGPLIAGLQTDPASWLRLLEALEEQADEDERLVVAAISVAIDRNESLPELRPRETELAVAPQADLESWWNECQSAYYEGRLRDEDLLLDPRLTSLRAQRDLGQLLQIRRDF